MSDCFTAPWVNHCDGTIGTADGKLIDVCCGPILSAPEPVISKIVDAVNQHAALKARVELLEAQKHTLLETMRQITKDCDSIEQLQAIAGEAIGYVEVSDEQDSKRAAIADAEGVE